LEGPQGNNLFSPTKLISIKYPQSSSGFNLHGGRGVAVDVFIFPIHEPLGSSGTDAEEGHWTLGILCPSIHIGLYYDSLSTISDQEAIINRMPRKHQQVQDRGFGGFEKVRLMFYVLYCVHLSHSCVRKSCKAPVKLRG
jgi:hypothetical protein